MEKLKDPAMLLAIINSIGLLGTSAYFYRQLEALRVDLIKTSQTLTGVVRKISEMEKGEQHKGEALHTLNDQIKSINQRLNEIPSLDTIDDIDNDFDELVAVLAEHEINVERPSQMPKRRSGDRRGPPPSRRVEEDFRRDTSSRKISKPSSRGSSRDTRNSSRSGGHGNEFPQDTRTDPPLDDDDDSDLIKAVRRQQPR